MTNYEDYIGAWRRDRSGRWVVCIDAAAMADFDGRREVKVAKRRGGHDLVVIYKVGKPFTDTRTGKTMVYGHASARMKVA